MPDFTVLQGGGLKPDTDLEVCTICGVPHLDRCRLLGRHLRHLELLGRSACTVYERKRCITRLGAWLVRKSAAESRPQRGNFPQADSASACGLSDSAVGTDPRRGNFRQPDPTSGNSAGELRPMRGQIPQPDSPSACGRSAVPAPVCVADATAEQLYAWRESLRVADATAATYISSVKGFFSWMAAEGIRDDDPSAQIPAPKTPRRLPRPISEPDLMRALEAAPERIRLMIVLMAWCGLRCKEVALLRRENIRDRAENPVLVIVAGSGKGKKERAIPMNEFVVGEVQAARLPQTGYCFPRHDSADPVFYGNQWRSGVRTSRAGPLSAGMVSRLIGEHLRSCDIAATGHQLRHRYGTQAYAVSEDLLAVKDLMGHSDVSSTTGYVLVAGLKGKEIVSKLPVPPKLKIVKDDAS